MAYKPLYIFMSPASIPQIVAHIQDYLVKNPIVSTETVAEIVVKALSEHPELINGSVIPITEDSQQTIKEYIDALPTLDAYTKAQVDALLTAKQDTLTFDQTPTADSTNPVTSGGVASALASLNTALTALISSKADLSAVYTKTAVDLLLSEKADADDVYSKNTIDAKLLQYPTTENVYTKADIDLMKQVNKANIAITSTDGTAPIEILAGQYVYLADVLYMATETIQAGTQLIPEGNITINSRGVTNRIGDGLKNAVTQLNGLAETVSNQSQQIETLQEGIAIIVDGDTASVVVPVGGYAYVKNNTHGLADGLYKNTSSSAFPVSGGMANSTVFSTVLTGAVNDSVSALNSKFGKLFTSEIKDLSSVADGQSITCTIDITEKINIGLIIYYIRHCGDNKPAGGFWRVYGLTTPLTYDITISQAMTWDSTATGVNVLTNIESGTYTLTFENHTGVSTDDKYNSRMFAMVIKLK